MPSPILDYAECAIEREAKRFECEYWQTPRCLNIDGVVCPDCPNLHRIEGESKARAEWMPSKHQVMAALLIGSILFLGCVGLAWAGLHRYQQYEISEARR